MTSQERQELILQKMRDKGIEVGSGVPNKKYDSEEVYELIHIANCFPELREKNQLEFLVKNQHLLQKREEFKLEEAKEIWKNKITRLAKTRPI